MNNGSTSTFDITHQYTVKGNYTLQVTIVDAVTATFQASYGVAAWPPAYFGGASLVTRIEGYGIVSALQRETFDHEPITAIVQNTGSAYIAPITVDFYGGSWSNHCYQDTSSVGLLPGDFAYFVGINQVLNPCDGHTPIWAKATSSSWPALNATSPGMTVNWGTATPAVSYRVNPITPAISMASGGFALAQYQIVNTGQFSLDFYDSAAANPGSSLVLMPSDLGNPDHSLFMNGSARQTALQNSNPPQGLFQGVGRIFLQPGQSVTVNRTIQAVTNAQTGTITLDDSFTPRCPVANRQGGGDSYLTCGIDVSGESVWVRPQHVTTTVTLTIPGASIAMTQALALGNGTEQFTGQIISMGTNTPFVVASFIFWKTATPATTFKLAAGTFYAPGTVTATATGLAANTNYTVEFVVQSTGPQIISNPLVFVTQGGCTGLGCAGGGGGNTPNSFVQAFLFFLSSASGVPVQIFGLFFGLLLIGIVILAMLIIPVVLVGHGMNVPEIPVVVWAALIPMLVIVNTLFFFWPSFVVILVIVPEAIMLAAYFLRPGSAGGGSPGGGAG